MPLRSNLGSPERIQRQVERSYARSRRARSDRVTRNGEPSLAHLIPRARSFARHLAREIRSGAWSPSPVTTRLARLDKPREISVFRTTDHVVQYVFAELLFERMLPLLPDCLHSFRKKRSNWTATRLFARYVRSHVRCHPDPRDRGLYVLRVDVASYGDSIPMGDDAPLWDQLTELLELDGAADEMRLLRSLVRPPVLVFDGSVSVPERGIATGSPVGTAIANLYLIGVDRELAAIPGAFFARYGDDMLFAHESHIVVEAAKSLLESRLTELGLQANRAKERVFYFNGAGRRSHLRPDLSGSTHLRYLGCRIDFRGVVGLSDDKCEEVLLDVTRRIRRTAALCLGRTTAERAGLLSYVANAALDPSAPGANKWSAALRGAVTDRGQLETLDRSIARILAEVLSGRTGCRAFRYIPYRDLRRSYGLRSLVVGRNGRGGRSRSGGMR
ncbi:MAG: hypothetical protein KDA27_18705 [Candidatus Eisenbacteria bacterium]|uniref:Reverse transcriptase domain-containing protein n=1 Tax=Eiseniibacteriota bacterium TaxID=2212470 RepID=A0A956NIR1_UNCEI|nr:hypothetical protein [Candidatus Eisenbacteria bacterium]